MKRQALVYGIALGALILLLKFFEYQFTFKSHARELFIGFIALFFTVLGLWLGFKLIKPKKEIIREIVHRPALPDFIQNDAIISELNLSARELEVLQLMAMGLSNQEIADKLFVSLNTVKTHGSRLFEKLEVNRRTMAISKARELRIIP